MWSLHLFSLLLIIVVNTARAITPLPPWIQIDQNTCGFVQTAALKNAFSEMIDIASAAYNTITTANNGGLPSNIELVLGRTAETYFGIENFRDGAQDRYLHVLGRRF
jgi:hypothetical protein